MMSSASDLVVPAILEFPGVKIPDPSKSNSLESQVLKMIRRIRPDWRKEDIILQLSSKDQTLGGLIYSGYTDCKAESVCIRLFPTEADRNSLDEEIKMTRVLAFLRLGPRLFATFSNGIAFEAVAGLRLNYTLGVDVNIYPVVARKIGYMHRELSRLVMPWNRSGSEQNVFSTLRQWLNKVPVRLRNSRLQEKMKRQLPSRTSIEKELLELVDKITKLSPRTVFCHGNLSPANIVYDSPTNSVSFVGLQFCGPNFQAFEVAQHFMTLCGPDLDKVGKEEFVPAREFQLRWCHHYLAGYNNTSTQTVSIEEIQELFSLVQKFTLVFCLQEVVWSLVNTEKASEFEYVSKEYFSQTPTSETDEKPTFMLDYGIARFQQYHRNKYNILSMQI